jgi:predicted ArsR family transcriptional regulator
MAAPLRRWGITRTRIRLYLRDNGPQDVGAVARAVGVSVPTAYGHLAALVSEGALTKARAYGRFHVWAIASR